MRASGGEAEGAECCPEQLDSVPKHGTETLCSNLRLRTQSRAQSSDQPPQVHPPCPLQPTSSSALSPLIPQSFLFPSSTPSLPGAPHVLFLSLAWATDFPFPSSDPTPVFPAQIVSSFALKLTYIQISIWSFFELTCYFFPSKPLITITVSMRYTLILIENACFP